jgi:hypothetical protein
MKPVGLEFFRSEYDDSVIEIYREYLQREAPVFMKNKEQSIAFTRNYVVSSQRKTEPT